MKISYNWLSDYITPFDLGKEELAQILTDIGLEVESIEPYESIKGGLKGLIVGEVLDVDKHPNADRLQVTKVNVGNGENLQIVCGAPNVAKGQKVVVAQPGSTLYPTTGDPFEIKRSKIRGVESLGMICAEDEIGLGESHDGIMILPEETNIGVDADEVFEVYHDTIFEIGLTPNRSDAMCHIGVAYDLYAYLTIHKPGKYQLNVKESNLENIPKGADKLINVEIQNRDACKRYAGVSLSNVSIKESPNWLQSRLKAIGVKPISNIVDITNYVLWEYGQPLHAFDADQVKGNKVIVGHLKKDTIFTTLDETERKLHEEDLMICNAEEGMCIAGVFGGIKSGVSNETTNIFLESAYFDSRFIRRTSQRHGLRTDAAVRYEKGADPGITVIALKRAVELMVELSGATVVSDIDDQYLVVVERKEIQLAFGYVNKLIGQEIPNDEVVAILKALQMEVVSQNESDVTVKVPTNKFDVTRPADLVEEIIRIYGFNQIELKGHISLNPQHAKTNNPFKQKNRASQFLVANGFFEAMTNSLVNSAYLKEFGLEGVSVPVLNYSSKDLDVLRPNMIFSGLQSILYNINRGNHDVKLFDFGKSYMKVTEGFGESHQLVLSLTGKKSQENWSSSSEKMDVFYVQGVINSLLDLFGHNQLDTGEFSDDFIDRGIVTSVKKGGIAWCGSVTSKALKQFDIKQDVFVGIINWSLLLDCKLGKTRYTPIPKYPSMRRDLSLLLNSEVRFKDLQRVAMNTERKLLRNVGLFDIYQGKELEKGKKSYALSFVFQDDNKTLTDKVIDKIMKKIINALETEFSVQIR